MDLKKSINRLIVSGFVFAVIFVSPLYCTAEEAASQRIFAEIKPQLRKDFTIDTTGHSLGGAVAVILAMYLDVNHYAIGQVVTFGK
ncbi:MAG: hypothetical protein P1P89_10390 [Desulfobacterales bacterium]|nr:hypothetical protein [Desulfobacterales bacterium]